MRHNIKYSVALLVVMPLLCALFASCTDDIDLKLEQQKHGFTIVGDPVDVSLSIAVSGLAVDVSTRAEEPTDDFDPEDTEDERHIDDLWIFEYDQSSGDLIYEPKYVAITNQSELANVQVTLSNNYGKKVVIYVVANAGSGVEDDGKGWVVYNTTTESYDGFMTLAELEKNTIPTPHPQRMIWDEEEGTYVIYNADESIVGNISIPMAGYVEETVTEDAEILIPVERMFAKVIVRVDLSDFNTDDYSSAWLNTISIGNIPEYSTVGTLWDGDKTDTAKKADYSGCSQWLQRRFNALGETSSDTDGSEPGDDEEVIYPYLIYVPENIQGENQVDESTNKADNVPSSIRGQYGTYDTDALSVTAGIYVVTKGGSTLGEYNTFIAYPGGNETTNFNVRRNCVYRVTLKINDLIDPLIPSANCIVCLSGETTAFYPYCREETGGGYKFTDYLDAYDDTDEDSEESKKIYSVKIIWQSTDANEGSGTGYIGDNSDGKLVWIDEVGDGEDDAVDEYHRRIHVKIDGDKTGNALVGAYNKAGVIIWSWHIWSRLPENDPTTVNTKLYYTYEWDENGIYGKDSGRPRVAGYTIMNCNLGAMADEPSADVSYARNVYHTFGTLYQWGRKDPFPPAMPQGDQQSTTIDNGEYNSTNVYSYFDNSNAEVTIIGGEKSTNSSALFYSVPGTERAEASEAILNAIHNPTVFYASTNAVNQATYAYTGYNDAETALANNYSEPKDGNWLKDSESEHFNRLWGGLDPEQDEELITKTYKTNLSCLLGDVHLYDDYGEKSIFDPCPYGWRVSPPDLWLGFTDTGLNPGTTFTTEHYNYNTNYRATGSCGVTLYLTGWIEGESSFFPSQGIRAPDGAIMRMGACGNYNNATADAGDRVNILHTHYDSSGTSNFHVFEVKYLPYYVKGSANSVRCVRIASVEQ